MKEKRGKKERLAACIRVHSRGEREIKEKEKFSRARICVREREREKLRTTANARAKSRWMKSRIYSCRYQKKAGGNTFPSNVHALMILSIKKRWRNKRFRKVTKWKKFRFLLNFFFFRGIWKRLRNRNRSAKSRRTTIHYFSLSVCLSPVRTITYARTLFISVWYWFLFL